VSILSILNTLTATALGLFGFGLFIAIHEFGHFFFCKLFNVLTPTFSIGFGPKLLSKKIGDTLFTLSLIPLGGYVEIAGNEEVGQGEQKESARADERSFKTKKTYQKVLIMSGGILANLVFAYAVLFFLFIWGAPASKLLSPYALTTTVEKVLPASEKISASALHEKDIIVSIDGTVVENNPELLVTVIAKNDKPEVQVEVLRDNQKIMLTEKLNECTPGKKYLAVSLKTVAVKPLAIPAAFMAANNTFARLSGLIVSALKQLCAQRTLEGAGGPLRILSETIKTARTSLLLFLLLLAFLSINLALINLIPLPIFDGGQIITILIEKLIGRELPDKARMGIHLTSWAMILLLLAYLTYKDFNALFPNIKKNVVQLVHKIRVA